MKLNKNPLFIVANVLIAVAAILTSQHLPDVIQYQMWQFSYLGDNPVIAVLDIVWYLATPLSLVAVVIIGLSCKRKGLLLSTYWAAFGLGFVFPWLARVYWEITYRAPVDQLFWPRYFGQTFLLSFASTYLVAIGFGLFLASWRIQAKSPEALPLDPSAESANWASTGGPGIAQTSAPRFDPYTGAPLAQQPAPTGPRFDPYTGAPLAATPQYVMPSSLPTLALVFSFLFPLVGIILGHVSLSQMRQGRIPSSNRGNAVAGVTIGYIFIGIGIISWIVFASIIARQAYYY